MTKIWECPHCMTELDGESVIALMKKIECWLQNRPSASMDPAIEKRERLLNLMRELKQSYILTERKPSKMMESQNGLISEDFC